MPEVSGIKLLEIARQRWPGAPFVMMTGNDAVDHVVEPVAGRLRLYFKAVTLAGLWQKIIATIRRHLAGGSDQPGAVDAEFQDAIAAFR